MTVQKFVIQCISQARGDDLARAKMAFKGFNTEQMQQQHGQSGHTRKQVLDEYQSHSDMCDAAVRVCKRLL